VPAKNSAEPASPETDELSFEEAVAQLEAIVDRIERGEIGLERALAEYERGVRLVTRCRSILDQVEQRIDELSAPLSEPPDAGPGDE